MKTEFELSRRRVSVDPIIFSLTFARIFHHRCCPQGPIGGNGITFPCWSNQLSPVYLFVSNREHMSIFTNSDSVNAIVADIGSYATKIGHAGEDYPRAYFRSVSVIGPIVCPVL